MIGTVENELTLEEISCRLGGILYLSALSGGASEQFRKMVKETHVEGFLDTWTS